MIFDNTSSLLEINAYFNRRCEKAKVVRHAKKENAQIEKSSILALEIKL